MDLFRAARVCFLIANYHRDNHPSLCIALQNQLESVALGIRLPRVMHREQRVPSCILEMGIQ